MASSIPESAACLKCGYALRGLSEPVCPECGRPFDPDDALTYRDLNRRSWWHNRPPGPPSRKHVTVAMVLTLCVVVACSSPSDYFPISCLAYFIIGPGVVLGLLVDWVRCLSSVSYSGGSVDAPPSVTKRRRWAWAATPVALLLIVSALASPWPTWVRFAMSESAFERAITDRSDDSGGLVGFYSVSRINRYKNGAIFFKTGPAFMDEAGFAYLPKGELPEHAELYVGQELAPGWYVANLSW